MKQITGKVLTYKKSLTGFYINCTFFGYKGEELPAMNKDFIYINSIFFNGKYQPGLEEWVPQVTTELSRSMARRMAKDSGKLGRSLLRFLSGKFSVEYNWTIFSVLIKRSKNEEKGK